MLVIGIDAHKRSHTVVAVDDLGRQLAVLTVTTATTSETSRRWCDGLEQFESERAWAVEDCRQLSRRLERDLLRGG